MIVGEAHVVVRAITNSVGPEIRRAFNDRGIDRVGEDAGRRIGDGIGRGISRGSGGGGFFSGLVAQSEAARAQFDNLIRTAYTLGPAFAGAAGAISSLIGALAGLASTIAGALPALSALPGLLANLAIAGGTLKLAFAGVGEAIGAGMKQATGGTSGAASAVRDLSAELRRLKDAQRRYDEAVEDGQEAFDRAVEKKKRALTKLAEAQEAARQRLKDAEQDVADAIADGAEAVSDARERLAEVERTTSEDVQDAKKKVYEAQLDLNEAYAKAREEVQQLQFAAEDAALGEKKAALQLEKARETLLRVQDLPPNSRARREAELAFAQADLNYRKAMDTNKDMAKEQERISKEGVDGTKTVQDAKKKLNDAVEDQARKEADAARKVADARAAITEAEVESAQKVAKAEADLSAARIRLAREERDAEWERQDIIRAFNDEQEAINKRIGDAKRELARAEKDYAKAAKEGYGGASGGANAYQQALAKLSPEQRKFVDYMVNTFMPEIEKFQALAAKEFFPKLIPALEQMRTELFPALKPLIEETGSRLGDVAQSISDALRNPQTIANIETVWTGLNEKILPKLSNIGANAIEGFTGFLAAAQPLVDRFVGWIETVSADFKAMFDTPAEQEAFTQFLDKAGNIAATLGDIFGNVFGGLGEVIKSQMEPGSGGYMMLEFIQNATQGFEDFAKSEGGIKRIEDFFKNTAENAQPILGFVGDLAKEFLKLGENPNIKTFFDSLNENDVAGTIGDIANAFIDAGPEISDFVTNFLEFSRATLESEGIKTFFSTLSTILGKLTEFFESPAAKAMAPTIASLAAAGVALRTSWSLLKVPVLGLINPIAKTVTGVKEVSGAVKDGIGGIKNFATGFSNAKAAQSAFATPMMQLGGKVKDLATNLNLANIKMGLVSGATKVWTGIQAAFNAVMAMNPIGLIVIAIAGLIAGLVLAYNKVDWFRAAVDAAFAWIKETIGTAIEAIVGFFRDTLWPIIESVWGNVKGAIEVVVNWFRDTVWPIIQTVIDWIKAYFQAYWTVVQVVWNAVKAAIEVVVNWLRDTVWPIIQTVIDWIKGGFETMKERLATAWAAIKGAIEVVGNWLRDTLWPIVQTVWDNIKNGANAVWTKIQEAFNFIKTKIQEVFAWVRDTAVPIVTGAWTTVKTAVTGLWDKIKEAFSGVKTKIEEVFNWIKNTAVNTVTGAFTTVKTAAQEVWDKIKEVFGKVKETVEGVAGDVKKALSGLWSGLSGGLSSAVSSVKRLLSPAFKFIVDVANQIRKIPGVGGLVPELSMPSWLAAGATGAIVTRPTLALIGEAGPEALVPLNQTPGNRPLPAGGIGLGGDVTINVYAQPGMDEMQLAKIVSREISFMMRKGSV